MPLLQCMKCGMLLVCAVLLPRSVIVADEQLTSDGQFKQDPVFVGTDATALIYTVRVRPEQLQLLRLQLDTQQVAPLFPDQTRSEFEPSVSGDGRYLAFVQSRGNLSLALVIRNLDTGEQADVPPEGGFSGVRAPCFSADGERVYYSYPTGGRQQIFSVDRKAGDKKTVIDSAGINNWPHASPDGKSLVFASTRDGDYELYLANIDGSQVQRLTHSPGQDIRPRFSPDGRRIAFTSNRDGNYEIYVLDLPTKAQARITQHPERDDYAIWHPRGGHLVHVGERNGRFDLYLLPVTAAPPTDSLSPCGDSR